MSVKLQWVGGKEPGNLSIWFDHKNRIAYSGPYEYHHKDLIKAFNLPINEFGSANYNTNSDFFAGAYWVGRESIYWYYKDPGPRVSAEITQAILNHLGIDAEDLGSQWKFTRESADRPPEITWLDGFLDGHGMGHPFSYHPEERRAFIGGVGGYHIDIYEHPKYIHPLNRELKGRISDKDITYYQSDYNDRWGDADKQNFLQAMKEHQGKLTDEEGLVNFNDARKWKGNGFATESWKFGSEEKWEPGQPGRGLVYPSGVVDTWNSDLDEGPFHADYYPVMTREGDPRSGDPKHLWIESDGHVDDLLSYGADEAEGLSENEIAAIHEHHPQLKVPQWKFGSIEDEPNLIHLDDIPAEPGNDWIGARNPFAEPNVTIHEPKGSDNPNGRRVPYWWYHHPFDWNDMHVYLGTPGSYHDDIMAEHNPYAPDGDWEPMHPDSGLMNDYALGGSGSAKPRKDGTMQIEDHGDGRSWQAYEDAYDDYDPDRPEGLPYPRTRPDSRSVIDAVQNHFQQRGYDSPSWSFSKSARSPSLVIEEVGSHEGLREKEKGNKNKWGDRITYRRPWIYDFEDHVVHLGQPGWTHEDLEKASEYPYQWKGFGTVTHPEPPKETDIVDGSDVGGEVLDQADDVPYEVRRQLVDYLNSNRGKSDWDANTSTEYHTPSDFTFSKTATENPVRFREEEPDRTFGNLELPWDDGRIPILYSPKYNTVVHGTPNSHHFELESFDQFGGDTNWNDYYAGQIYPSTKRLTWTSVGSWGRDGGPPEHINHQIREEFGLPHPEEFKFGARGNDIIEGDFEDNPTYVNRGSEWNWRRPVLHDLHTDKTYVGPPGSHHTDLYHYMDDGSNKDAFIDTVEGWVVANDDEWSKQRLNQPWDFWNERGEAVKDSFFKSLGEQLANRYTPSWTNSQDDEFKFAATQFIPWTPESGKYGKGLVGKDGSIHLWEIEENEAHDSMWEDLAQRDGLPFHVEGEEAFYGGDESKVALFVGIDPDGTLNLTNGDKSAIQALKPYGVRKPGDPDEWHFGSSEIPRVQWHGPGPGVMRGDHSFLHDSTTNTVHIGTPIIHHGDILRSMGADRANRNSYTYGWVGGDTIGYDSHNVDEGLQRLIAKSLGLPEEFRFAASEIEAWRPGSLGKGLYVEPEYSDEKHGEIYTWATNGYGPHHEEMANRLTPHPAVPMEIDEQGRVTIYHDSTPPVEALRRTHPALSLAKDQWQDDWSESKEPSSLNEDDIRLLQRAHPELYREDLWKFGSSPGEIWTKGNPGKGILNLMTNETELWNTDIEGWSGKPHHGDQFPELYGGDGWGDPDDEVLPILISSDGDAAHAYDTNYQFDGNEKRMIEQAGLTVSDPFRFSNTSGLEVHEVPEEHPYVQRARADQDHPFKDRLPFLYHESYEDSDAVNKDDFPTWKGQPRTLVIGRPGLVHAQVEDAVPVDHAMAPVRGSIENGRLRWFGYPPAGRKWAEGELLKRFPDTVIHDQDQWEF